MAHSIGVINFLITSSVSSSGQWATKLLIANNGKLFQCFIETEMEIKNDTN